MNSVIAHKIREAFSAGQDKVDALLAGSDGSLTISGETFSDDTSIKFLKLKGVHFDGCHFYNFNLENSSFIDCSFTDCTFTLCNSHDCVYLSTKFCDVKFDRVLLKNWSLERCSLQNVRIMNSTISDCTLRTCESSKICFQNCPQLIVKMEDSNFSHFYADCCDNTFLYSEHCSFTNFSMLRCSGEFFTLVDCRIVRFSSFLSKYSNMSLENCNIKKMIVSSNFDTIYDFDNSILKNLDLTKINLSTASLLNTALVNCNWPTQIGTVSMLGVYKTSENLVAHPVQDVKGIRPKIKQSIATGQFLDDLQIRSNRQLFTKFAFRVWGATTSFGLSPIRLIFWSLILVFAFSTIDTIQRYITFLDTVRYISFDGAFKIFIGFFLNDIVSYSSIMSGWSDAAQTNNHISLVLNKTSKFLSYIVLGLSISIIANLLTRSTSS